MKFEVGDKVKYVRKNSPFITYNAIGIIVNVACNGWDVLFSEGIEWFCMPENLVKISSKSKHEQLVFEFME